MMGAGVSVLIPAFNAERFLAEAIGSALSQDSVREVIVVDDGSSDGTAQAARSFAGITVVQRANGGIGAARNTAVAHADGDLFAFLDADDVWPDGRMAALKATLEREPTADAVFGRAVEFGEGRQEAEPASAQLAGTMLIRRAAYERVGGFREDVKVGEFVDWWARAQDAGLRAVFIDAIVLRRRIHTTNTGIVQASSRQDYARVLRAALQRRRGVS